MLNPKFMLKRTASDPVIVIMVHNRPQYFTLAIEAMRKVMLMLALPLVALLLMLILMLMPTLSRTLSLLRS